jgi:hypothetical protein
MPYDGLCRSVKNSDWDTVNQPRMHNIHLIAEYIVVPSLLALPVHPIWNNTPSRGVVSAEAETGSIGLRRV